MSTVIEMRIAELQQKHGGIRPTARVLGMDQAYLLRLKTGDKCNPSKEVLEKLGLKRVSFIIPL